jgi:anti-sigma factor RsiW
MDCQLIRPDLVGFHFGNLSPAVRDEVESHLVACPDCLRGYLALKRELETARATPRPSEAARARLRRTVAAELAGRRGLPVAWRRPLAFGFAAAAAAATLLAVVSVRGQLGQLASIAAAQEQVRGAGQ